MTKQDTYECDWCFQIIHYPQRSIHNLTLDKDSEEDKLTWDICSECYDKFMKFLKEIFKE